ncbi:hypothetical protein [uncultured Tateyamaria sp.]|uniref:hypothetical protein n=1 Tax=uncultured Tateyamaria sp. TaxID=455651 RepID=UPI002627BC18|nr:hypothetical protein [uncultured Tateyamaria sp.]
MVGFLVKWSAFLQSGREVVGFAIRPVLSLLSLNKVTFEPKWSVCLQALMGIKDKSAGTRNTRVYYFLAAKQLLCAGTASLSAPIHVGCC